MTNYYMVAIVFLPLVSAELRNQHINVDLWPRVPPTVDRLALRLTWALSAAVYGLLAWNTWRDAVRKYEEGEFALDQGGTVLTWPGYFLLPLGFALITFLLIAKIFRPGIAAQYRSCRPMSDELIGGSSVAILVLLLFLRVPIGVALTVISVAGIAVLTSWKVASSLL